MAEPQMFPQQIDRIRRERMNAAMKAQEDQRYDSLMNRYLRSRGYLPDYSELQNRAGNNPNIDYGAEGLGMPMSMEMWPTPMPASGDPSDVYGQYFNLKMNPYYPNQPHTASANPNIEYGAQGLGMPTEQGMFPARENPNVRYSYDDQGWKAGLPESAGVNPTPYYSGAYRSIDPSFGDWGLQGPGSDLQQGFSAGEYFDPTITNPYTRNIPKKKPGGFGAASALNQITGMR